MKKSIKRIITGFMIAAVVASLTLTATAATVSDGTTFEEEYAKLSPHELEIIAKQEADGFTLVAVKGYTDKATGLYFVDLTFEKDNT